MIYTIEFELPDNETVIKNIKTARVSWGVWGYSGVTHAQPVDKDTNVTCTDTQPDLIRCADCKHYDRHDKRCKKWNHGIRQIDWCSRAERREDGRI